MGVDTDRKAGMMLMCGLVVMYAYVVMWIIVTPFIDEDHFIQNLFARRFYIKTIFPMIGVIMVTVCGVAAGLVMIMFTDSVYRPR